jgi:hypothetical protein
LLGLLLVAACDAIPFNSIISSAEKHQTGEVILSDGSRAVNGSQNFVTLINNPNAINPTYQQLMDFLKRNDTDAIPYTSTFVCADFANKLYNEAESHGIRAAFIVLGGLDHAINAFKTEDRGLIYIDFTGKDPTKIEIMNSQGTPIGELNNYKKAAYIEIGRPLGLISLDVAGNYGFDYSGYEKWKRDKLKLDFELASYNSGVEFSNANGGVVKGSSEYIRLNKMEKEINEMAARLGGFWNEGGVVTNIETFWQGYQ